MKRKLQFLFLILILFSLSCNKRENSQQLLNIAVRDVLSQPASEIKLSDFAGKISYIPLETNEQCLLSRVSYVLFTDGYLLVSDAQRLLQFDLNGKFVRQVGKLGKGPGEHGSFIKFTVDKDADEIILFSHPFTVIIYDLPTGMFKRSFNINRQTSVMTAFPAGQYSFFTAEISPVGTQASIYEIYLTDKSGNLIDSIADYNRLKNKNNVMGSVLLYEQHENVYFMGYYKDTLFRLDANLNKTPFAVFEMKNKIPWEELIITPDRSEEIADRLSVTTLVASDELFFIELIKGISRELKDRVKMVYNSATGKIVWVDEIKNDVDHGYPFWPRWTDSDKMIDFIYPHEVLEYYKDPEHLNRVSPTFKKLLSEIDEFDNPVLTVVRK